MHARPESDAASARAIEKVLGAEREAEVRLAAAREQARLQVEAAREQALAIVNAARDRVARRQAAHSAALAHRLARLRQQAAAAAADAPAPDAAQIAAAVERVVAQLTGGPGGEADVPPR